MSRITRQIFAKKLAQSIVNDSAFFKAIMWTEPETPSLSEMVRDAQELDPAKLRKQASRNWASIGRDRYARPGGV
jgi:hypothetical protein